MSDIGQDRVTILPRSRWWWAALMLLLLLASWLYVRGYQVSLPYLVKSDEAMHLLAAQHIVDFGWENGVLEQYAPGMKTLNYLFLKHIKAADAHQGTMLPAIRLLSIGAWLLTVVCVALLGALIIHPLTGLMAAAVWIVNPWVVERAHFALPDAYLTCFTILALWLALAGLVHRRRSFSTASVYFIMLAIVFKTQAMFVAPIILLLPMLNWRRAPAWRKDARQQTFWNCLRFAAFLFWLLLIYPTLEADKIVYFAMSYDDLSFPSLDSAWASLYNVWRPFPWTARWLFVAIAGLLLWRYRRRINALALFVVAAAALAWLLGMSMFNVQRARHYFAVGAILALLYGCGLTGLYFAGQEALTRLKRPNLTPRRIEMLMTAALLLIVAYNWLPTYKTADAIAQNFTLPDRRNELARYMDTSLPPGKFIADRDDPNHSVFNRSWGGYDGAHDFPLAQEVWGLLDEPLETWRENDAVYAIVPYPAGADDPHIYFPDETVLLKRYAPDDRFRGPSMVVLRLYPMGHQAEGQLGPIRLRGYDINATEFDAGQAIVLRHYWQADQATDSVQHVYNHLLNDAGEIVAQVDYIPLWDARRPSTSWDDPEEILVGREFTLELPADLAPGTYQLLSGLYDPETWRRLLAPDGGEGLHIAEIQVRGDA